MERVSDHDGAPAGRLGEPPPAHRGSQAREGRLFVFSALDNAIDDDFEHFDFASWHLHRTDVAERDCNWKLIMDAFAEGFHVSVLHRNSLARFFLTDCVLLDPTLPTLATAAPASA